MTFQGMKNDLGNYLKFKAIAYMCITRTKEDSHR